MKEKLLLHIEGNKYKWVNAERVEIKGFENLSLYIHKSIGLVGYYDISEKWTGKDISCGSSRQAVIKEAEYYLNKLGRERFYKWIDKNTMPFIKAFNEVDVLDLNKVYLLAKSMKKRGLIVII